MALTIEPDGVRPDHYVIAVSVEGVERERATWASLDKACAHAVVVLHRFSRQVFR